MQFIKIDKDFQNRLRPLNAKEYKGLEDLIKKYGCLEPIKLWNGYIADGHNRYEICMKNGIHFEQVDVTGEFETKSDVMKWIVQNQIASQAGRQLTKTELVQMALAIEKQVAVEAAEKMQSTLKQNTASSNLNERSEPIRTASKAAESIGVSENTYRDMKLVVEKGSEEQIERMNKGGRGNAPSAIAKEIKQSDVTKKTPKSKPLEPAEDFLIRSRAEAMAAETRTAIGVIGVQAQKITEERLNGFLDVYKKKELEDVTAEISFMIEHCKRAIKTCEAYLETCRQ